MALFLSKSLTKRTSYLHNLSSLHATQQRNKGGYTPTDMPIVKNKWMAAAKVSKICESMKNVAAGALPSAERSLGNARPFSSSVLPLFELTKDPEDIKNILHVPIGTERGMCGVISSNTVKTAYKEVQRMKSEIKGSKHKVVVYGKRSAAVCRTLFGSDLLICFGEMKTKTPSFEFVSQFVEYLLNDIEFDWDKTIIYYNEYENAVKQHLKSISIYKSDIAQLIADIQFPSYEIEADETQIVNNLVEFKLASSIYMGLVENFASEQGSRLRAMDTAYKNCNEMVGEYERIYQGLRKTKITNELIVSAVAVKLSQMKRGG